MGWGLFIAAQVNVGNLAKLAMLRAKDSDWNDRSLIGLRVLEFLPVNFPRICVERIMTDSLSAR